MRAKEFLKIGVLLLFSLIIPITTEIDDYLLITAEEKVILDEFRTLMRPYLHTPYMKEDIYLIRWLRAKNFKISDAKEMLLNNLRWRKQNNMDSIKTESWSDLSLDFPYEIIGCHDFQGRPVSTVSFGSWNVRMAAISGKLPRLTRYLLNLCETCMNKVIEYQYQGRNVTQLKILMNLDGWNIVQHGCPLCLPIYRTLINAIQNYYTGYVNEIILINVPVAFKTVLDFIHPIMNERARKVLKIFGSTRTEWENYLDKRIPLEERTKEFGGNRRD